MLHNSGAYGPNETPINASTPVNMSQGSAPLNIARNLQNLSDIAQQPIRGPSGHYNLPNYPAYNLDSLDMRAHLNTFSNHQLKGFHSEYAPGDTSSVPTMRWQNGMAPLNLNAQSTYVPSLQNYLTSYEKQQPNSTLVSSDMKDQNSQEDNNLITTEDLTKASSSDNYFYNTNQDSFNNYNQNYNTSILKDRLTFDITKRKSLENTVKLIENILINTSKDSPNDSIASQDSMRSKTETKLEYSERFEKNKVQDTLGTKLDTQNTLDSKIKDIAENYSTKIDESNETDNQLSNIEQTSTISLNKILSQKEPVQEFVSVTPKVFTETKIKIEIDVKPCPDNYIKEEMHSFNSEYQMQFTRDVNGIARENVTDENLIISDNSIDEAIAVAKSGSTSHYFECPFCALLFNHPKRFLIHTKWHTFGLTNEKRIMEARERELQKKQRKEAKMVDQIHKTIDEEGKTYPCKDCSKIFVSKSSLKNHRARHHSGRIRECNVCGAVCLGWAGLKAHSIIHDEPFRCNLCGKNFRHKHSLARHAETHMDEQEKNLRCEICGKTFAVLARFKEHQRVHVRAERGAIYQCTYCAKSFTQSYSLTIHERTHRNEKPYTCSICNTSYGTNSSLKRHLKVSHNSSKPFECSQCGRCFSSERALNAHTVRLHSFEQTGDPLAPKKRKRRAGPKKPKGVDSQIQTEPKTTKNIKEPEMEAEQVVN